MDVLELEGIDDDLDIMEAGMFLNLSKSINKVAGMERAKLPGGESDLDRPMSRLSVLPTSEVAGPSANELRLGRRVLDLEKERDAIAAELSALKAKHASSASTSTILVSEATKETPVPNENRDGEGEGRIEIPHSLLPILNVMRHHIAELARDNHALRYTLGLAPSSVVVSEGNIAASSKITLDGPSAEASSAPPVRPVVDLETVVRRVRALVKENEELGDMVMEAGKGSEEEYERAMEDSRKVIESLDADLTHHAEVVQKQKEQLRAYSDKYGPLNPAARSQTHRTQRNAPNVSLPTTLAKGRELIDNRSPRPHAHGSEDGRRHGHSQGPGHGQRQSGGGYRDNRPKDRDRDRGGHNQSQGQSQSHRGGGGGGGQGQGRGQGGDFGPSQGPSSGTGGGGGGRREDDRDRASKRRR